MGYKFELEGRTVKCIPVPGWEALQVILDATGALEEAGADVDVHYEDEYGVLAWVRVGDQFFENDHITQDMAEAEEISRDRKADHW